MTQAMRQSRLQTEQRLLVTSATLPCRVALSLRASATLAVHVAGADKHFATLNCRVAEPLTEAATLTSRQSSGCLELSATLMIKVADDL